MIIGIVSTRNATDILEQTLTWHLNHGVDQLGIVIHLPTEEVVQIVDKFQDVLAARLVVTRPKFVQDQLLDRLRQRIAATRKLQAKDWFVHFDDDERWTGLDCLRDMPAIALAARTTVSTNYAPHSPLEHNFAKITHREARQTLPKLALRANYPLTTDQGNHTGYWRNGAKLGPRRVYTSTIGIDHFPVRTLAQFQRKVTGWDEVLHFRNGPNDPRSTHWVEWLDWHKQDPVHGLAQKFQQFMTNAQPITAAERLRLEGYAVTPSITK